MFFALLIHLSATIQYNISVRWLWDSQCHKAASPPQTDGSIAFATLRQCALLWGHNGATWRMLCNRTCDSFRPSESITQTANRSVQPFFHSSQQVSSGIPRHVLSLNNCPFAWYVGPINTCFLGSSQVHNLNGIWIGSAVLHIWP